MDETFSFLPEFLIRHRIWFRSAKFCATFPPGEGFCAAKAALAASGEAALPNIW